MDYREKLRNLAISETGFVFDPFSGATFHVNASGRSILLGLRDGQSREQLRETLEDEFEVASADLDRDISEFLFVLRNQQLLPAEFDL